MAKLVSKVYGDALFEAARDCGKMDEIFEEVQSIGVILEENAELQKILGNPRVMREDKEQMIETIFRGRVSNEIVELMKLMIEKGRYSKIDSVFEYFIGYKLGLTATPKDYLKNVDADELASNDPRA